MTYSALTPNGFPVLFTMRAEKVGDLLTQMETINKKLADTGYKPQVKGGNFPPKKEINYIEGRKCPSCGNRIVSKVSRNGKKFEECETRKYDFATKTTTGCAYMKWLEEGQK